MKRIFTIPYAVMVFLMALLPAFTLAQDIAFWSFDGETNTPTTVDPNASAGNATFGSGVGGIDYFSDGHGGDAYSANDWTTASIVDMNDYLEFTVTPDAGYALNLTEFYFEERRSSTGVRACAIRSSLDGFTADIDSDAVPDNTSWRTHTVSLGAPFQGLTSAVTFRIYGFSAEASGGTWRFDDVTISGTVDAALALHIGSVSGSPFCVTNSTGTSVIVPWSVTGTLNAGNVITAQLSDALGSFASPTDIGTQSASGTDIGGHILATIPANTLAGAGYRIRVTSSNPALTSTDNVVDLEVVLAPLDISGLTSSSSDAAAALTWSNPTNCVDEIMVVQDAGANCPITTTPSGTYSVNDAFGTGEVVYVGTGESLDVTSLTNGITYCFKVFVRYDTEWSAGVSVSVTPTEALLEIFTDPTAAGSSSSARTAAAGLRSNWLAYQQSRCEETYTERFATLSYVCSPTIGPGSATGAYVSTWNTMGELYAGTISFDARVIQEDNSDLYTQGEAYSAAGCGATGGVRTDADDTYQGEAPSPDDLPNTEYMNGFVTPPNGQKAAWVITFSELIYEFGMYLGDVESRSDGLDGYPGKVLVFFGGYLVDEIDIPTGTIDQSNCDGDANGDYDGCGNDETVWVQYISTTQPIDQIMIVVGEVDDEVGANINKIGFAALTLGGECDINFLPVELVVFSGTRLGNRSNVLLSWNTASEVNNDYFVVERSLDAIHYEAIGEVAGAGTTSEPREYVFVDEDAPLDVCYYRLRQVDFGGAEDFSHTIPVEAVTVSHNLTVSLDSYTQQLVVYATKAMNARLSIVAVDGRSVETCEVMLVAGENKLPSSLHRHTSGIYLIVLETDQVVHTTKVWK